MMTTLVDLTLIEPTCCRRARSAPVHLYIGGKRLKIFVLLKFQTVLINLAHLVQVTGLKTDELSTAGSLTARI